MIHDEFGNNFSCPILVQALLIKEDSSGVSEDDSIVGSTLYVNRDDVSEPMANMAYYDPAQGYATFDSLKIATKRTKTVRLLFKTCKLNAVLSASCKSGFRIIDSREYQECNKDDQFLSSHIITTENLILLSVIKVENLELEEPFGTNVLMDGSTTSPHRVPQNSSISHLKVRLLGIDGSLITIASGEVSVTLPGRPHGISFDGTSQFWAQNGIVQFPGARIDEPGNMLTLRFTHSDSGLSRTSNLFNVEGSDVLHLKLVSEPTHATAGTAFPLQPVIHLLDFHYNNRTAATDEVSVDIEIRPSRLAGEYLLQGKTAVVAEAGIAKFTDLQINRASLLTSCDGYCDSEKFSLRFFVKDSNGYYFGKPDVVSSKKFAVKHSSASSLENTIAPGKIAGKAHR